MKKRVYEDACGTAHALELIGDRWALLIVRELLLGPKRFSDLRAGLPGISANVLTQRLEELEAAAILVRRKLAPPAAAWVYELTPWGLEAEEVVKVVGRWAARSPSHDPRLPISVASTVMSMRSMFSPERAKDVSGKVGFRFGEEEFVASSSRAGCPSPAASRMRPMSLSKANSTRWPAPSMAACPWQSSRRRAR